MATIDILATTHQHSNVPFDVAVKVTGAPAGANLTVELSQSRGRPALWPRAAQQLVAPGGPIVLNFNVVLAGPSLAVLVAEGMDNQGTSYDADAERVDVR